MTERTCTGGTAVVRYCVSRLIFIVIWSLAPVAFAAEPRVMPTALLQELMEFPHAKSILDHQDVVVDYQIGLGAIQKVRGTWQLKRSERKSGLLTRYTWQIVDGFSSQEVMANLEERLAGSQLLYSCDGRSCGPGVQWANRIFEQRLLYGRENRQAYRVYGGENEAGDEYRLLIYSAERSTDRQYLHTELLQTNTSIESASDS